MRKDDPGLFDTRWRLPPLPAGHARLLAGVDPIGDVTAVPSRWSGSKATMSGRS